MYSSKQIQYQDRYLWGLILTAIIIILFELEIFPIPLNADNNVNNSVIKLSKGDVIHNIYVKDWIGIVQKGDSDPLVGQVCEMSDENICIQIAEKYKNINTFPTNADGKHLIPKSDINIIYHGEINRYGHYTRKGAGYGVLAALFYGSGWTVMLTEDDGLMYAPIAYMCGGAVFIPSGALFGYLKALKENNKVTEHILSDDVGWEIVL